MEFSSGLAEENATKLRRLKYWKLQRNLTRNYKDIITEIYSRVYLQRNCNRIRTTSHRNYNGIITTALQRNSNDITTELPSHHNASTYAKQRKCTTISSPSDNGIRQHWPINRIIYNEVTPAAPSRSGHNGITTAPSQRTYHTTAAPQRNCARLQMPSPQPNQKETSTATANIPTASQRPSPTKPQKKGSSSKQNGTDAYTTHHPILTA